MIKMLVAVINDVDRVESILKKLEEGGVTSGTIIDGSGMNHALFNDEEDRQHVGILRSHFNPERCKSKTLLFVAEKEKIDFIKESILNAFKGSKREDLGFFAEFDAVNTTLITNK